MFKKDQTVYWLGLEGIVENVTDSNIQVRFDEYKPEYDRTVQRWLTFSSSGLFMEGQSTGLTTIPGMKELPNINPDYDMVIHLEELDSKLNLVLDSIEELVEKNKGEA